MEMLNCHASVFSILSNRNTLNSTAQKHEKKEILLLLRKENKTCTAMVSDSAPYLTVERKRRKGMSESD
jgi:sensor histidine kinase regulating citrate/malate metabolism